jgi:DNA-binding NarL/FixJ family response regulator
MSQRPAPTQGQRPAKARDRGDPVAITVLGGEPAARAMAAVALARARRTMPRLGREGRDIVVVTADSRGYDPASCLPGSGLIVMTDRPSVVQAAAALLMGADAYLPVDLDPSRAAEALDRVVRGQTHIEPETAEALRTLVMLAGGLQPDVRAQQVRLLLDLRSRGWGWGEAADSVGVDARAARAWLNDLLRRIRSPDILTSRN